MARPRKLNDQQERELRELALRLRCQGARGHGRLLGRSGPSVVEQLIAHAESAWGVEFSYRGMTKLLNRLGLEARALAQGTVWDDTRAA